MSLLWRCAASRALTIPYALESYLECMAGTFLDSWHLSKSWTVLRLAQELELELEPRRPEKEDRK